MLASSPVRSSLKSYSLFWFVISLITLFLMATHQSTDPDILARYTSRYFVLLIVVTISTSAFGLIYLLARSDLMQRLDLERIANKIPHLGGIATFVACLSVGGFLYFVRLSRDPGPMLFSMYVVTTLAGVMVWILSITSDSKSRVPRWGMWLMLGIVILVVVGQVIAYLGLIPTLIHYDEGWLLNRAYTYANFGLKNQSTIWPLRYEPINTDVTMLLTGKWMSLVGVSLESARLFQLLIGYATVAISAFLTRRLYGSVAGFAALCVGLFIPLLHNYMRSEMMMALATSLGLLGYFSARQAERVIGRFWRDILVGLAIGFTIEGHLYGISFVMAFGLLYLLLTWRQYRRGVGIQALYPIIAFGIGAFLYGVFFVAFRIPDEFASLSEFLGALGGRYGVESTLGINCTPLERLTVCASTFYEQYFVYSSIEFALLLIGLLLAAWRVFSRHTPRFGADGTLLFLFVVWSICFHLILSHFNPYYWIYHLPFFVILVGAALAHITGSLGTKDFRFDTAALIAVISVAFMAAMPHLTTTGRDERVYRLVNIGKDIARMLPEDTPIAGEVAYYIGMPENAHYYITGTLRQPLGSLLPPKAIIITHGLDDQFEEVWDYIADTDMKLVRCYSTDEYDEQVSLYVDPPLYADLYSEDMLAECE